MKTFAEMFPNFVAMLPKRAVTDDERLVEARTCPTHGHHHPVPIEHEGVPVYECMNCKMRWTRAELHDLLARSA